MAGRYAPSPSGPLHLGNLRTAVIAWLYAQHTGREFRLRVDDLDGPRSDAAVARSHLAELAALGLTHSGEVLWQSHRHAIYAATIAELQQLGLVYECYCSRTDIQAAPTAPHAAPGTYPGTCRHLTAAERAIRRAGLGSQRLPALRLRVDPDTLAVGSRTIRDARAGEYTGVVDDFVLRRGDGEYAYNLAVVVDDAAQGVTQVVRGDDLLSSTPRQDYLWELLGHQPPEWVHVPLVVDPSGARLSKRDGSLGLQDLATRGFTVEDVMGWIADSVGIPGARSASELATRFDPDLLPTTPAVCELAALPTPANHEAT